MHAKRGISDIFDRPSPKKQSHFPIQTRDPTLHTDTTLSLRLTFSATFHTIDATESHLPASPFMASRAHQSLRFINSDLYYKEWQISLLLGVLEV